MPITDAELENRFTYHKPKDDQPQKYEEIRRRCHALALLIVAITPESREQSTALTKLEEVSMWANAAIARRE
jgi:hypothetical protein